MKYTPFLRRMLVTVVGLAFITPGLRAQVANNTALVGNVVDASGLTVAGAKVTAVDTATKIEYHGTTNSEGYYSITFIAPGTYDLTVDAPGFAALTKTGQIVSIDEAARTDFKLQVGSATTSVVVSASSPPIPLTTPRSAKHSIRRRLKIFRSWDTMRLKLRRRLQTS